jgi:iron complex outermembrane receptor protein
LGYATHRALLISGASAIAMLAVAGTSLAQTTGAASSTATSLEPSTVTEVVVTAQRAALESATDIKRKSDTIVDAVVAEEAGKLPDTSITEVLQRVPGVTMSRFENLGSPDQYSWQGSGIQVRGLSGVTSLLNGREVFSANGGNGLSFGEVTPELMAAVSVYKASTADLIEGGTGGAIDLRTHMPFDYRDPQVSLSLSASYGDFSKSTTPSGSVLLADRWDTSIGEFGAMIDLAYAKFESADSFIRVEPYYQTKYQGRTVYAPGGFTYGNDQFERTRRGAYTAFQWRPNADLTLWQTDFVSNYRSLTGSNGVYPVASGSPTVVTGAFNDAGVFQSGSVQTNNPASGFAPGSGNSLSPGKRTTVDFSQGFDWRATDRLHVAGALQIVKSWNRNQKYGLGVGSAPLMQENIDTGGRLPTVSFSNPQVMLDATKAGISNIVWYDSDNRARMTAVNLDVDYDLGDGFFRKVEAGGRYADRSERDDFVGTGWSATGRGWNGVPQGYVSNSPAGDFEVYSFPDFFKGDRASPGAYIMASRDILQGGAFLHNMQTYTMCSPTGYRQCANPAQSVALYGNPPDRTFGNPPQAVRTDTNNYAAYGLVRFESQGLGWLPAFTGNAGVRVVKNKVESTGTFSFTGGTTYYRSLEDATASLAQVGGIGGVGAWQAAHPGQSLPLTYTSVASSGVRTEAKSYTRVLPSINFAFKPEEAWTIRLALNKTLSPPGYNDIRATGTSSVATTPNPYATSAQSLPAIFNGYTYSAGNTQLKPAVSTNADLSIEWYPRRSTTAHINVFDKSIKDLIIYNDLDLLADAAFGSISPVSNPNGGGSGAVVPGQVNGQANFNATKRSTIRGLEIGGRTYFDMLPSPLKGLGVEANYTFIDSKSPDARARDMNGQPISGVPVVGLSRQNYNINLLYDLGRWDARLAYNWRSRYLATTAGNGTTGNYNLNGGTQNIVYALPVYGSAMGQLDGSVSYRFSDKVQGSVNFTNILNAVSRTEMEILPGQTVTRSWFLSDRRVTVALRASF